MNWKVLYVASRSEKKVNQRLSDLGLESYVPLKTERRRWSDRMKIVSTPMINGYVFVRVSDKDRDVVFKAQGVLNYVRYNGGDAIIRDMEIFALRSIEEKGYYVEGRFNDAISKGQKVEIKYGPFKGLFGIVEQGNKDDTYVVNIESIGYTLRITVPKEILTSSS